LAPFIVPHRAATDERDDVGKNGHLFAIKVGDGIRGVFNQLRQMESYMTRSKRIAPRSTADFSAAASPTAIALGITLAIAPTWARAETQVRGTPQAVVVEAQNATVQEILIALSDTFEVQFRSAANLDKRLTGTYEGTLQQAVSRVLKGYDFVVKSGRSGLEITLLGAGKPVAVVEARSAKKSAEAVQVAALTPTATADNADQAVPQPRSDGPTPPIKVAQGPGPVPTPAPPGAAPFPVPQLGSGPAPMPMPPQPGAAPAPMPPLPTATSAASLSPMPAVSAGSPTASPPVPSSSATVPPAR
jgi:hypothetical protein